MHYYLLLKPLNYEKFLTPPSLLFQFNWINTKQNSRNFVKNKSHALFILVFISIFALTACTKDSITTQKDKFNLNYEAKSICNDDIVDNYINMAALSLLELIQDRLFVDLVHEQVDEMFDDDHDVLFKTLQDELNLISRNLVTMMGNSLDSVMSSKYHSVNKSQSYVNLPITSIKSNLGDVVNGIEICNSTLYLQIYVPNFESADLNTNPIIAMGHDDNPVDCITFGYQLIGDTIFIIDIDSAFASNNLVWVIGVNDVVGDDAELPESFFKMSESYTDTSSVSGTPNQLESRTMDKQVRIHSIWLRRKNRTCFLCGKDPVAFVGYFSDYLTCSPVDNPKPINAGILCKVGKNDLNKWINVPTDKPRAWIAHPQFSPLRRHNEAIEFVWYTHSNRSRYGDTFRCDDPQCPNPVPQSMTASYQSRYNPYGSTTYIGTSGNRPLHFFDVPATSGMTMITNPDYSWFGHRIRFHGSNVAL